VTNKGGAERAIYEQFRDLSVLQRSIQAWPNWVIIILLLVDLIIRIIALGWIPHNRRPSVALGWLLAIFLIPYVGIAAFLLLGSAKLPKRRRDKQSQMNAPLPRPDPPPGRSSGSQGPHARTAEHRRAAQLRPRCPADDPRQRLRPPRRQPRLHGGDGRRRRPRRQRFVHFEFYIVAIDDTTRRLLESLLGRACNAG
jgi:cardiolipin synthase